jgi:DNA-binding response OmpR family regulator
MHVGAQKQTWQTRNSIVANGCASDRANKLLLVDDDVAFCSLLSEYFQGEDFQVECLHDGREALERLRTPDVDITILEVMMPGMNGLDVLREMRTFSDIPVLMLTARGEDIDRFVGLETVARLGAILRRGKALHSNSSRIRGQLTIDDIEVRLDERAVLQNGTELALTSTEFDVLDVQFRNAGTVVEKVAVSSDTLKRKLNPYDRSIDMYISRLQRKLGELQSGGERIKTVRGTGYR